MAISIQLSRQSTVEVPDISSYKIVVQTINAQNMPDKIFVNQRIRNFARERFDNVFVAVCTPVQLEDFAEDAPEDGSSYYRTNSVELIARTAEELQAVFDSLVYETKKLVIDLTDLDSLAASQIYTISADSPVAVLPLAPEITGVFRDDASKTLSVDFTYSAVSGITILSYQHSIDGGVTWYDSLPRSTTGPVTVFNTDALTTYNLKIRAVLGKGKYGPPSDSIYVATLSPESAPTITTITPANTALSVAFTPTENSNATNYEYSTDAGAHWTTRSPASSASPLIITGLTNSTAYTIKIRGTNALGCGVASGAAIGTPEAPPPIFWAACSAGAGIIQIDDLTNLETNWKQDTTGAASGWAISKSTKNINLGSTGTGTLRLRCCYKNTNKGSYDAANREYPSVGITQLSAAFSSVGYFRMTINGKRLFNLTSDNPSVTPFSYYPAAAIVDGGFGTAGSLALNQTGLIDILIESSNLTNVSGGSLRFNLFYA
jgi:hypothetical protein